MIAAYLIKNVDGNAISYVKIMNKGEVGNIMTVLGMSTDYFAWQSTVFTIPFILTEVPSNLMFKWAGPRNHFTRIMVLWSIAAVCQAAAKTGGGLLTARFFLGLFEGGLYPGILAFLTYWYRADELAVRFVILGVLGSFSGIVVAILAWGLTAVNGHGLWGWQALFLVTGLTGFFVAILIWFFLPGFPSEAKFLTERERVFVQARLTANAPKGTDPDFDWQAIKRELKKPQLWLFTSLQTFQSIGTYGLSFWLPSLIAAFGFTTTQSSQLLNIPPAAVSILAGIFFAWISDRTHRIPRPVYMLVSELGVIGSFCVLALVKNKPVLYAFILVAQGTNQAYYAVLNPWRAQTIQGAAGASFAFALQNGIGQIGGIIGPQVFRSKYAPNYRVPFAVCMAFQGLTWFLVLLCWYINRDVERQTRQVAAERKRVAKEEGRVSEKQVKIE